MFWNIFEMREKRRRSLLEAAKTALLLRSDILSSTDVGAGRHRPSWFTRAKTRLALVRLNSILETPRSTADARVGEDMKQREFEAVREDCEARVGSLAGASYTFLRFAGLSRAHVPLGCSPTGRATPPHFVFVQLARTWRVLLEVTWVWKQ